MYVFVSVRVRVHICTPAYVCMYALEARDLDRISSLMTFFETRFLTEPGAHQSD